MKITPQRQLLFRLLHGNLGHPTAEGLFAAASSQMPGISLRTVYQTLNDLVAMGELRVINFTTGSNRFDPNTDDHHHAECTSCGGLHDVYLGDLDQVPVQGLDGFERHATSVVFHGVCAECSSGAAPLGPTHPATHHPPQGSHTR